LCGKPAPTLLLDLVEVAPVGIERVVGFFVGPVFVGGDRGICSTLYAAMAVSRISSWATSSCAAPSEHSLSLGPNPPFALFGMLVVDSFAEPLYGMPYTDRLGREICVDVSFN
jgi:hypothetical protein